VIGSTFSGNSAQQGGAIYTADDPFLNGFAFSLHVNNSAFSNNVASSSSNVNTVSGGAIYNSCDELTVTSSTFSGNTASAIGTQPATGGAISNQLSFLPAPIVSVTNSTFSSNSTLSSQSPAVGGAIYNSAGSVNITNATLSTNFGIGAPRAGGGIYTENNATLALKNNIIANNIGDCVNPSGTVTGTHNLILDSTTACGLTNGSNGNLIGFDPLLGPLSNNGGPTKTFALGVGSPALDAGTDVTTLSSTIDKVMPSIAVADATAFPADASFAIRIDNEQMIVTGKTGNTLTVTRGANGTSVDNHSNGAAVNPAFDQRGTGFNRKIGTQVDIGAFERSPLAITAAVGLARSPGATANSRIAFVTYEGIISNVVVTLASSNPSNGVTLSNIVNTNGAITADVAAAAAATTATFKLQASDGLINATDTLTITICNNAPPVPTIAGATNGTGTQDQACPEQPLTLTANSSGATSYQWYKNGNAISGQTNSTLNVTTAGTYTAAAFANGCPSTQSAGYVVQDPTPTKPFITPQSSTTFCAGGGVTLQSDLANGIQWYKDGALIPGANSQNYVATASGSYTAQLNALGCHSAVSDAIAVTVLPPQITVTNSNDSGAGSLRQTIIDACVGATISFDMTPGHVTSPITLTSGELGINKNLTITGPGANLMTVDGNHASRVFNVGSGTATISGLTIANGTATGGFQTRGGGILISSGVALTLIDNTLSGNSANGPTNSFGGAIDNSGTLTLTNSTLSGNSATGGANADFGGAIFNSGTATVINSTLSGNIATGGSTSNFGGAIFNNQGTVTLTNSTVSNNSATGGANNTAGGIMNVAGTLVARNTIIAKNTSGSSPDVGGNLTSQGHNLIGGDPKLGPLADNGGPTQTMALLAGSPAIDAGDDCVVNNSCTPALTAALTTDQRDFARKVGAHVDIGAFEVGYTISVTGGSGQSTPINTAFATQMQATVTLSGSPASGITVTFTAPATGPSGTFVGNLTTVNVITDANGVATAPTFSANGVAGGPYNVVSSQNAGPSANFALTNDKGSQTVTFAPIGFRRFGDTDFVVSPTASTGLPVSLIASGNCTVTSTSPGTVHITGAGACTITASQAGDSNYNAAPSVPQSFNIGKASQTIALTPISNKTFGDTDFGVIPTASSGLPVGLAATGNCTVTTPSPGTVHITAAGTCTITASQAGDSNYNAAPNAQTIFKINKANQTIAFGALATKTFGDSDFNINPTASSGLPVSLAASGNCTVTSSSPGTTHITGAGSCTITASQAGNANFNAAADVPQSFSIAKASPVTAVASSVNPSDFNQSVTFTATATSAAGTLTGTMQFKDNGNNLGAPITVNSSGVAQFTTSSLTPGTHTITVDYSGDANFAVSTGTLAGGQVVRLQPSLSINDVATTEGQSGTKTLNFTVTLSAASNLTVTLSYATADGTATAPSDYVAIPSTLLTFNPGETSKTIPVTINGDVNFEPDETFTVNLSTPVNATIIKATGTGTILNDDAQGGFFSFNSATYDVNENDGAVTVTITRTNDVSQAANVDYATDDTGASTNCAALNTGLASQRCDYTSMFGTLRFAANETQKTLEIPINLDAYTEGPETFSVKLSNPTNGAVLVAPSTAVVTITDSASPTPNAIDDTTTFVRQQYRDFLNRDADPVGLAFWKNNIDKCNDPAQRPPGQTLAACIEVKRIVTSAAFFLSIEFKQTGGLVRDFYVASLNRPVTNNMPDFVEFMRDTQAIQKDLVVGQGNWQQVLDANRLAFMNEFVTRAEFVGLYPTTDTPTQYVNKLYQHAALAPNSGDRAAAIVEFGAATTAADPGARARALLRITQDPAFQSRELLRAFVQMEYFGYLRRNPNDPPDTNFDGYNFWLDKLIRFNGDFLQSAMAQAFLNSLEYRKRFGP
jgi:hypothetical protein